MKCYLAGLAGRHYVVDAVKAYLVSTNTLWGLCHHKPEDEGRKYFDQPGLYILESVLSVEKWMFKFIDKKSWNFMLDSGAFTFMAGKKNVKIEAINWNDYVDRYAEFILEHGIELFFELDIDVVVGLQQVEQLRHRLEQRTGRQAIPVWHKSRGLPYWKSLVKDYRYVAIGGIVVGEIKRNEFRFFNPMCDIAHDQQTQVHGLGFSPRGLKNYRFDSVDSTNWTMGNRSGFVTQFTGTGMSKTPVPTGHKLKAREAAMFNFREWVKYQRYLLHAGWNMNTSQTGVK